jgi:hypothetical protein
VRSVPKKFGAPSEGSLKADEWRTMATIYIPLAFISLWGENTPRPSNKPQSPTAADKLKRLLHLSMLMVSAVRIACMYTMSLARATAYRACLGEFLALLPDILPNASFRDNDHMAMHIYDFLLLFGPIRSWWCFPFERLIGKLQRLPHNHKFGKFADIFNLFFTEYFQANLNRLCYIVSSRQGNSSGGLQDQIARPKSSNVRPSSTKPIIQGTMTPQNASMGMNCFLKMTRQLMKPQIPHSPVPHPICALYYVKIRSPSLRGINIRASFMPALAPTLVIALYNSTHVVTERNHQYPLLSSTYSMTDREPHMPFSGRWPYPTQPWIPLLVTLIFPQNYILTLRLLKSIGSRLMLQGGSSLNNILSFCLCLWYVLPKHDPHFRLLIDSQF